MALVPKFIRVEGTGTPYLSAIFFWTILHQNSEIWQDFIFFSWNWTRNMVAVLGTVHSNDQFLAKKAWKNPFFWNQTTNYIWFQKINWETSDLTHTRETVKKTLNYRGISGKQRKKHVETLVPLLWRAATPGLKPFCLLRSWDYAGNSNNYGPRWPKLNATDMTARTFFERLCLVLGLALICASSQMSVCSYPLTIHSTLISRFLCNFFPWTAFLFIHGPSKGYGTQSDHLVNPADKKLRGHSGKKSEQKSRNRWRMNSRGCGCMRTIDLRLKCDQSWNQIQLLKDFQFVTFIAFSLDLVGTKLLEIPAQFLIGSCQSLWIM